MTRDEAIALREDQLNGKKVDPFMFAVALKTIRETKVKKAVLHQNGQPRKVLEKLAGGPVERGQLYGEINKDGRCYEAMARLMRDGLVRCEVKLTEAGLRALGLVGPRV